MSLISLLQMLLKDRANYVRECERLETYSLGRSLSPKEARATRAQARHAWPDAVAEILGLDASCRAPPASAVSYSEFIWETERMLMLHFAKRNGIPSPDQVAKLRAEARAAWALFSAVNPARCRELEQPA